MLSKNHNTRTNTATRTLQAVPDTTPAPTRRAGAEDKLWATLHAHPAATAADLAVLAEVGRSTAGKILSVWAAEGSVARTSRSDQGGRRGADTWTICDTTPDHGTEPTVDQRPAMTVTDEPVHDTAPGVTDHPGGTVTGPMDQPPGLPTTPGTGTATPGDKDSVPAKAPRLGKGALRGMVEDYLAEHPGEQFSPSAIGKALNRSSGAVNNALEKLVANGYALQTQDRPKRFRINANTSESAAW